MSERTCFDCGKKLEWVGRGPGWMNSEQWDATKAGEYFAPCDRASHPNGNCYFNEGKSSQAPALLSLKPLAKETTDEQ